MNAFVKAFIITGLAVTIFGGGGFLAYELFFKKKEYQLAKKGQPVVTPTPDPVLPMLQAVRQHLLTGDDVPSARDTLVSIIQSFPASPSSDEARQILGTLNLQAFFSPDPGPNKTEYIVARGDSIGRIAAKTKATPELIFKANGLSNPTLHPGRRLIIPSGQFSLTINLKKQWVTLLNRGAFFKWYKPLDFKMPPRLMPGQYKVSEKIAWFAGARVGFGDKRYLGSSRWIVTNHSGLIIFSETNPQAPNAPKPATGIMLSPADLEELFALVSKSTPLVVE
ncbi:MAG: LysM peptidoglycan-binding domain-containing protein [Verrucomicrobia bacterium]|nr:LysM peptidoglycan-binding domain-containing protein [Verrucomicrobiota bacterium]